ncbi:hypothetical protein HYH03_004624 [Edaphochlamys debaryana]|uniref:Mediator of RNA polymerase II transcription subunit 18 n=1 Tax=Edaphochlamys debaryana TaxID=47281 RepID=A0A836C3A3_9CHLO|nr:hypothetical protein HYH03_004624 [Edaphochlamys debaryana]|eukprot:KAG2497469.1 hypothetical protein HYH03_004624 [Edaphochlamys debaryana]
MSSATPNSGANAAAVPAGATSLTECRALGMVEKAESIGALANLLRSLCASYTTHATHMVVLRLPLPLPPGGGAPPGGLSTLLRLTRRLPVQVVHPSASAARQSNPFLDDPPERWEVRHEGPLIQGPALNSLPASMREVTDAACWGAGALEFWKGMGGKVEYECYREGNEYLVVFHGHEIKVVLASVYALQEPGVLRDGSSVKRLGGPGTTGMAVEVALLVPEGRHYEGANLLGAFGAQLAPHVRLARAEAPPPGAAAAGGPAGARRR